MHHSGVVWPHCAEVFASKKLKVSLTVSSVPEFLLLFGHPSSYSLSFCFLFFDSINIGIGIHLFLSGLVLCLCQLESFIFHSIVLKVLENYFSSVNICFQNITNKQKHSLNFIGVTSGTLENINSNSLRWRAFCNEMKYQYNKVYNQHFCEIKIKLKTLHFFLQTPLLFYPKHCTIRCLEIFPFLHKTNTCTFCNCSRNILFCMMVSIKHCLEPHPLIFH